MKYVLTALVLIAVSAAGALLFALSGLYNISAAEPHWPVTLRFIQILRDRP